MVLLADVEPPDGVGNGGLVDVQQACCLDEPPRFPRGVVGKPAAGRVSDPGACESGLQPHSPRGDALCHRDDPGELLERPVAIEKVDALGSVTDGACYNLAVHQLVCSVVVRLRSALHDDAIARSGERVGNVP
ncbi:MAG: hypothetical protein QOI43_436, partial [Gaiellales bacterium]|nr:hypothetical protein [Gaiellales bacterium]